MGLQTRLNSHGCAVGKADFLTILTKQYGTRFASWSVERLLRHERASREFCERVRANPGCEMLPDSLILWALSGGRYDPAAAPAPAEDAAPLAAAGATA